MTRSPFSLALFGDAAAVDLTVALLMLVFGIFPYESGDRQLGPEAFLAGFGHSALITICRCLLSMPSSAWQALDSRLTKTLCS